MEKVTVYDLLARFETEPPKDFAPAARLFEIFKSQFLDVSVNQGLINLDNLAVSGDGTPVYTDYLNGELPDGDAVAEMYERGVEKLSSLGFKRYEVSNFCKKGFESRHNFKLLEEGRIHRLRRFRLVVYKQ